MQPLRFFLSSTAVDLGDFRKEIIRFLEIIPSDLFAMEFFGSDEAKPKDYRRLSWKKEAGEKKGGK